MQFNVKSICEFGSVLGFEFLGICVQFGSCSSVGEQEPKVWSCSSPKVKPVSLRMNT